MPMVELGYNSNLEKIITSSIEQKKSKIKLYPQEDTPPITLQSDKTTKGQMRQYDRRLREWMSDPIYNGGDGVEGFVFEILTTQVLSNVFSHNGIKAIQSPAELDFIQNYDRDNPSCDILLCHTYEDGYIPLLMLDTSISRLKRFKHHEKLLSALINVCGIEDLDMILPQTDILSIGMDSSGQKFFDIAKSKTDLLRNSLTDSLYNIKSSTHNNTILYKIDTVLDGMDN